MFRIAGVTLALLALAGCAKENRQPPPQTLSGGQIFAARCAPCHGPTGAGDTPITAGSPNANLTDTVWGHGSSKQDLVKVISDGIPGTAMRGFRGSLSPEEIDAVAGYVQSLSK